MSNTYKDRTIDDAVCYLNCVFGIKSIKELSRNEKVRTQILSNASDGYILDCLLAKELNQLPND